MKTYLFILLVMLIDSSVLYAKNIGSFQLKNFQSQEKVSSRTLLREKEMVINFWASWCVPCMKEIPLLEKLKKDHPAYSFIAINAGESKKKIFRFVKKTGFSYRILEDPNKTYSKSIGITSLPQTLVIDQSGKILYQDSVPPKDLNF